MAHCMVIWCKNRGHIPGISYFKLTKNRHDAWMEALGRNPNTEHLSPSNAVCSEHFAEEHIIFKDKCVRLKPNAVPTLKLRKPKESLVENLGYLNRAVVQMPVLDKEPLSTIAEEEYENLGEPSASSCEFNFVENKENYPHIHVSSTPVIEICSQKRKCGDANVTSKPEVQSVESIPETSSPQPDGYLSEHTPSSSQMEDIKKRPRETRICSDKIYCRMCLEYITARNQMVPLTLMDINFPSKNAEFKRKKEMETDRITDMIQAVMPDFDFDAAYNPIVCNKCVAKLETAYKFITGCRENEKLIQLYKSKYCPNMELVSCEDVVENKSLLLKQSPPRKKQKTSKEHISTESVSGHLLGQSGSQLEQRGNTGVAGQERYEIVYTSSAGQEDLAPETSLELHSSIKHESEDYESYDGDSHFLPAEEPCIVKEEIVVKEDVSFDFADISNNERVAQMNMDYHVKDEDCSQPDALGVSDIDDYHKNSTTQYSPTNQKSQTFNRPKT